LASDINHTALVKSFVTGKEPPMAKSKKPAGKPASTAKDQAKLYTLEVALVGGPISEQFAKANPVVARTIQIRGNQTLADLHDAIFDAFDREEEHMYEFQFGKKPMDRNAPRYTLSGPFADYEDEEATGDVEGTTIAALGLGVRQKFFYWFDFGDDWWHQITVKGIEDEVPRGKYPRVTERVGKSPPQYPDFDEED
jgi:Plasmid pRiA4b ORF-3-like protein